ncbi:MAG: hypothetical protein ACOYMX_09030, partial [Burkholderiales bacterium]
DTVRTAGEKAGELLWELPLHSEYRANVTTHFADLKNASTKQPSTINGGLFLSSFIEGTLPWAHWDIAASMQVNRDSGASTRGASGKMTRALFETVRAIANDPLVLAVDTPPTES